jgi:nucleoside-diphosphate-sugar epimerase
MKLLIVGGAGYVGSILRPALEQAYDCYHLDFTPIPEVNGRQIVADLNDEDAVRRAVYQKDALLFLAMGKIVVRNTPGHRRKDFEIEPIFNVNATGYYRVLSEAMREGVRRVVYASTLSVYSGIGGGGRRVNEHDLPNATDAYGVTKRLGEVMNDMFAQKHREATLVSLRLMWPRNEKDWPGNEYKRDVAWCPTGPNDLRRLFLAALDCRTPGSHVVQATGDLEDRHFPNIQAQALLGWRPRGE